MSAANQIYHGPPDVTKLKFLQSTSSLSLPLTWSRPKAPNGLRLVEVSRQSTI